MTCERRSRRRWGGSWSGARPQILPLPLILLGCLTARVACQDGSHQLNPCQFNTSNFLFCQCDPDWELINVTEAKCWIGGEVKPSEPAKEWKAIGRLVSLQSLEFNMRYKELKFFVPRVVFRRMSNLTVFVLKMAEVERVPSLAFANSSSLREVSLASNEIHVLEPNALANMASLTTLNLQNNLLVEVNRGVFVNLPSLTQLYLDQNQIRLIHDRAFAHLHALEELDLHLNNLTTINPEVFENLHRLRRLDLRFNAIDFLGERVFEEMPMLEELDLTKNQIISVHPLAFAGLKMLARLNLEKNKIVKLDPRTFESLSKVYFLDLRQNALETLEEELVTPIYENLRNVSTQLLIEGNRFVCDCRILWIQNLYKQTESQSVRYHLNQMECNFFQRHKSHGNHHRLGHGHRGHGMEQGLAYGSNITMVSIAPEETTSLADFDSTRKVLGLDPKELDCEEKRMMTTTIVSIQTQNPLVMAEDHQQDFATDDPVMKGKKVVEMEHNVLSDTPDLNPSQSSQSSPPSAACSGVRDFMALIAVLSLVSLLAT